MSNAIQNSHSAPANKAGRSFSRFVRTSVKPVVFKLSRKLSVTYWPGRRRSISAVLLAMLSGFVPGLVHAGPTGGQVVAGSASVLKPTSSTTQINQASQNAIINWQSFSIGAGEAVRFAQPSASAVALNRVIGSDPSRIFGSLTANGKVFLVNSAGVYFAPGASVDVGGMVASSLNISNASFMSGKYQFEAGANAGAVTNDGHLRGAFVVLAAPKVSNAGSIVTTGGTTALAAGGRVSLDIAGDKLVSMSVDAATANAAVSNSGSISADGGKVFMTASSANAVLDTVINTSGIVRAGSIVERNGQIVIDGGAAGTVQVSGTLAASGAGAGTAGGAVRVLGQRIALQGGANIDVSGDTGGGSALVGGDVHGVGGVKTAAFTEVSQGAVINADALTSGDGGKVVVWADQHTGFRGAISAKGGAAGGDGGFVETSGKKTLAFAGKVNTTAARGATGTLLLDPTDITISNAPSSAGVAESGGVVSAPNDSSNLSVGDLTGALTSSNIIVDTASGRLQAGNIDVIDAISWSNTNSLTLKANGHIAVSAPITNTGSGGINLQAGGAINTGSLSSNGGTISVIGDAGVVIDGALATTNTGVSAIIVNAGATGIAGAGAGGDVTISGGSLTVGAGGRATLYTGTIAGSTGVTAAAGPGSGNFRYNSDSTTTNFTAALGTGVNVVYREQPTLTVGVTSTGITYGDATPTFTPTYSGLQNGDMPGQAIVSGPSVSVSATSSPSGHIVAGTHTLTPSAAAEQLGYGLAYDATGVLTVAQKALVASGSTVTTRDYDGTTAATVNTSTATVASGGVTSADGNAYTLDDVSVNTAAVTAGTFADKNAGIGKTVSITGLTLQGADALNYTVSGSASGTIAPKALTATVTAPDKIYDGGTMATPTLSITGGLVGVETVGASGTATFNSKDVVTANLVTVQSATLADGTNGGLAANYTLGTGQTATAHITPKALTATLVSADKTYDGTTGATAVMSIDPAGLVNTETVTASGTGTFNTKDVLTANLVTVSAVALADGTNGGLASNYSAASGQTGAAQITPKTLTATVAAPDKVYDGNTAAAPVLSIASGLVGTETVTATGTASFNTKDVVTANQVTVNSASLADGANGGLASNYDLGIGQTGTAHITPKALTLTLASADKVYDGNTTAAAVMGVDLTGLVGSETVTATGNATFNTKDVLTANLVTVNTVALADGANGGLGSNYSAAPGQTGVAHITPKTLTAIATAPDKVYDGTTVAAPALSIDTGLVGSETVAVSGTGAFNTKDVLTANQVTVNSVSLADGANGGLASNYDLAAGQTATAHITPKALTASVVLAADKTYDGSTSATASMSVDSGLVGTETVTASGTGAFNTKDVLTANLVTVNNVVLADGTNGGLASNYSAVDGQTGVAHITPKALTVSLGSANKIYDGTDAAAALLSVDSSGLVGTEIVTASGAATFNTKDVLTANLVTVGSVTLADGSNGGLASNYSASAGQTYVAQITPKALTATAIAPDKTYDGNAVAAPTLSIASGLVASETLGVSGTGTFNSKDVLTANLVTVDSVALADGACCGLASNYSLTAGQTATAHITPKALTATAAAADKVYDGSLAGSAVMNIASAGLIGTETVTGTGTGLFNTKDVLTANQVAVDTVVLADGANGGLASNYSLGTGQAGTAHITPKALAASVSALDKVYDGNTVAAPTFSVTAGLVNSETVAVSGSAAFNSKDVASASLVTVSSVALADGANGGLASNYSLGAGQTATAHITPKALSATASAPDKVYNGNNVAAPTLSISAGLVGSETVAASGSGTFNSKDVLAANLVTVNSVALADGASGGLASNYSLAAGQTATAHITPKALAATVATTKVYDGNTSAGTVMNISSGLVGTETVTGTGTGVFNSKNVNAANQVTVNSVLLADGANGGLASNYSLGSGQVGTGSITVRPSVTWTGPASGNWSNAANWEAGAIPDFANVANVVIPTGKSVMFDNTVPGLLGAVRIAALDGGGVLTVSNGNLTVANALQIGSYAQAAGQVSAASLKANGAFSQTGGKVTVAGQADITQASGAVSLGDFGAASLSISGGANVTQLPSSAVVISDTLTLGTGNGDVTLSGVNNNFNKVVIGSAHNVTLAELGTAGISLAGSVAGDLNVSATGPVSQSAALSVQGSTVIDTGGAIKLDDMPNALHGRVEVNSGGDTRLASSGALAIGGDVGGNLVLTSAGAVSQASGDALLVNGTSSVDAGTNAIALTAAGNHFTKALAVKGGAVSLVDSGALVLGQSTAGTLSVKTGGALSQAGKLAVAGTTAIDATGKAVVLNDNTNTFGGKVTLNALSATLNTVAALDLDATVAQSLSVAAANATVTSAEALSLHLQTAATTVNAAKALSIDGAVTGPLTATAGGAVTQTAALTVSGASAINAAGQAVTLADAGNDFGGALSLKAANTQVVDKNALALGASTVSGTFKASAKGDVTQTGALAVAGTTAIDTTGALQLANSGNDFVGAVSATASTVTLADQNVLTLSKVTTGRADLSAVSELQVAPGGLIDAPNILLSLSPDKTLAKGIGTTTNSFAVKDGASVTLGVTTPAVSTYLGGTGIKLAVLNPAAELDYRRETKDLFLGGIKIFNGATLNVTSTINSQVGHILVAAEKKADSNAELIERGLVSEDLRVPVPYPHSGAVKALGPRCEGAKQEDGCK
jgi:filamentous hemagglutinin family protein